MLAHVVKTLHRVILYLGCLIIYYYVIFIFTKLNFIRHKVKLKEKKDECVAPIFSVSV